jgi:hypothetical protein
VSSTTTHGNDGNAEQFTLHPRQHHRRNLLGRHVLRLSLTLHAQIRLSIAVNNREWERLDVFLHLNIVEPPANQALDVVQRVLRVLVNLIFRRLPDQALGVCERDPRRSCSLAEIISDDFDVALFEHGDTTVGGTQVNADNRIVLVSGELFFALRDFFVLASATLFGCGSICRDGSCKQRDQQQKIRKSTVHIALTTRDGIAALSFLALLLLPPPPPLLPLLLLLLLLLMMMMMLAAA